MKAGFAALGRRIAKLEADAPRRDGLILVKSGMRGNYPPPFLGLERGFLRLQARAVRIV